MYGNTLWSILAGIFYETFMRFCHLCLHIYLNQTTNMDVPCTGLLNWLGERNVASYKRLTSRSMTSVTPVLLHRCPFVKRVVDKKKNKKTKKKQQQQKKNAYVRMHF